MNRFIPLAALLLVTACAVESSTEAGIDRSVFTENTCAKGYAPFEGVNFSMTEIYVELVDLHTSGGTGGVPSNRQTVAQHGVACDRATDKPTCLDAIKNATPAAQTWARETCGGAGCQKDTQFFILEGGGVVTVIDTVAGLTKLVAPIENPNEAVLLAVYARDLGGLDCSQPQARALADGSYEVFLGHGDGKCTDRVEQVVHVAKDGTTTVTATTTTRASEPPSRCVMA